MSGSVGGIAVPRYGTSLSSACSLLLRPKSSAALAACGLVSFIWPSTAPVTRSGDMPPISAQMCFQLQPFSRLISSNFSVSWPRVMDVPLLPACGLHGPPLGFSAAIVVPEAARRGGLHGRIHTVVTDDHARGFDAAV